MGHPNEELLRAAYGLRERAEVASIGAMLRDDVVWHASDGDLRGRDEVLKMLAESDRVAASTISREIHALFADEGYGIVLVTVRAERDHRRRLEALQVHAYRFLDARIAEAWVFLRDPAASERSWSS